jgi:hypothetical protein
MAQFGGLSHRSGWTQILGRSPLLYPYTALMHLTDTFVCFWLPEDWARINLVVCELPPCATPFGREING